MKNWTSFFRIWAECNNHYTIHQLVPTDGIEPTYRVLQTRANPSQLHWLGSSTVNRTQILRLSVVCSNSLNYGTILLFYYFFTTFLLLFITEIYCGNAKHISIIYLHEIIMKYWEELNFDYFRDFPELT